MISRLLHYLTRNLPDPAWRTKGYRYRTPMTYDQQQGEIGRQRSLKRQAAVRQVSDAGDRRTPVLAMDRRKRA